MNSRPDYVTNGPVIGKRYTNQDGLTVTWKTMSDESISAEVINKTANNLQEKGIFPDKTKDFVFISPSANIGSHEVTIFKNDAESRLGTSLFLIGDIANLTIPKENAKILLNDA